MCIKINNIRLTFVLSVLLFVSNFAQSNLLNESLKFISSKKQNDLIINRSKAHFPDVGNFKSGLTVTEQKINYELLPLINPDYLLLNITLPEYINSLENAGQFQPYTYGKTLQEQIQQGTVKVYVYFNSPADLQTIAEFSEAVINSNFDYGIATIIVKVKNLWQLASLNGVYRIRTVLSPQLHSGSVVSEGDSIHQTYDVRNLFGDNGSGIKIGVISNGVDSRSSSQTTGDLPPDGNGLTVLSNTVGGDEGTAMLETIYDMVPGAGLYFHDYGSDVLSFMSAIDDLVNAGCNIICDDVSWITQPFFEDGIVAQHIDSLLSTNDILYITPAGNNSISHYQGEYNRLSGTYAQHDFSNGTSNTPYLYFNLPAGGNVRLVLQWNDKFGSSGNDYDLYLYSYSSGSFVAQSTNYQNGSGDPLEFISYTANSSTAGDFAIVVNKYSGSGRELEVFIYLGSGYYYSNNISGVDAIFGHAALDSVITVGAVKYSATNTIEPYSSLGPSTIEFPGEVTRNKPDIVAVDGTKITGAGGFGIPNAVIYRFYGTSASTAHVTGIIAQVWSNAQVSTGSQAKQYLLNYSLDEGQNGFDNTFGYGIVNSLNIYQNPLPVELSSFTYNVTKEGVRLNWITQTELNNYGFEIDRLRPSDYAASWEKIGFVEGHGNSNSPKYYVYVDKEIRYGKYLYRLKQIDNDGSYEYSKPIEVDAGAFPDEFILEQNYPNPFNPSTTIRFSTAEGVQARLIVYDILGNEVEVLFNDITEAGKIYHITFIAGDIASGIYYYRLITPFKNAIRKMILLK